MEFDFRISGDNWLSTQNGSMKKLVKLISESFFTSIGLIPREKLKEFEEQAGSSFHFETYKLIELLSPKRKETPHFWSGLVFIEGILWKKRLFLKVDHHKDIKGSLDWLQNFLLKEKKQIFKFSEILLFEELNYDVHNRHSRARSSTQPEQFEDLILSPGSKRREKMELKQSRISFGMIVLYIFMARAERELESALADSQLIETNFSQIKDIWDRLKYFTKFVLMTSYLVTKMKEMRNRRRVWEYLNQFNYFVFAVLNFGFNWQDKLTSMEIGDNYLKLSKIVEDLVCSISGFLLVLLELTNETEKPLSLVFNLRDQNFVKLSDLPVYNLFFKLWLDNNEETIIDLSRWDREKVIFFYPKGDSFSYTI